jgi:hypothetical protein
MNQNQVPKHGRSGNGSLKFVVIVSDRQVSGSEYKISNRYTLSCWAVFDFLGLSGYLALFYLKLGI